jgi:hypothetical protein
MKKTRKNKRRSTFRSKNRKLGGGANYKEKHTAIILEPRKHKALAFVLQNALENLNQNWNVRIYHGTKNKEFVEDIIKNHLAKYKDRISLENLGIDNFNKTSEYSKKLLDKDFIKSIPTETFLVFQTDSMINPNNKHIIDRFMKYDYVGAPWKIGSGPTGEGGVGNGGFSLRKRSKMLDILKNRKNSENHPVENVVYHKGIKDLNLNVPSAEEAREFSIEQVYHPVAFALHKAWLNLNEEENEKLKRDFPGLEMLISLQGVVD